MIVVHPKRAVAAIIRAGDAIYAPDRVTPLEADKIRKAAYGLLKSKGPLAARDYVFNFMHLRSKWGRIDRDGRPI